MKSTILKQISLINDSLNWIKKYKPDQYEQRFLQLVAERCRLRKLLLTVDENPAIAAYGESQKGKSYVITNMLSDNGSPFTVKAPEREYDFVKEINPITNNVEATGVVTRFSTFGKSPEAYNAAYPVLIKLLSLSQVATILCDGYHRDITDYCTYSDAEMLNLSNEIFNRYKDAPQVSNPVVVEDDILDMKYYLGKFTAGNVQYILRSPYFDRVALVASKIPAAEWEAVFAPLWHRNPTLSRLFSRLASSLSRLGYASSVYLPIEAVLNTNNTLMSVQRISELGITDKTEKSYFTDVLTADGKSIPDFDKSELSALCAEAVFKVEERFLNSEAVYDFTMITDPEVKSKLSAEPFKKNILRNTDLLDFPGARARIQLKEENLEKTDTKSSMSNDANVYLRAKVAYLFNRYSDTGLINTLLFCHDNAQRSDDNLYITIENWVKQYVGESPQQRARTLELSGGVSPFFIIATKFNIDMTMADANPDDVANSRNAIDQRWADRFNVVLYKEVIHGNDADWFRNWTRQGSSFNNSYLLRDYKYSGDTGKGNNLFLGFRTTGREQQSAMPDEYFQRMRTSFIESPYTKLFFADPAVSFDVATTLNNDGALYLFQRLSIVSQHIEATRKDLLAKTLASTAKALLDIIKGYYHDGDAARRLQEDIRRACAIRRELVFASNRNNYFFGRMIQRLQTTEKDVYNVVYDAVQNPELNSTVNDFRNYELIRKDLGARLDRCSSDNDNAQKWECLIFAYNFADREEAEDYLASKGVEPAKLFSGNFKPRTNSAIISECVFNAWIDSIKSPQAINELSDNENFDPIEMSVLVDNIEQTARQLEIPLILDKMIAPTVNVINVATVNVSLIADQMASEINKFVCNLGFDYRSKEEIDSAVEIIDKNPTRFDPVEFIYKKAPEHYSHAELTELFDRLNSNPTTVTPAFENNYYRWIEYMTFAFLLKGNVVDYDTEANDAIGKIIEEVTA